MFDEPMANSSKFALPRNTAPSRSNCAVTVLSYGGTNGPRILLPAVVRTPSVQNRSLIASGMPVSAPLVPAARAASAARACASARHRLTVMKAFSRGFSASIASRCAFVSSTAEKFLRAQPVAGLGDRQVGQHHSTTFGTA